MPTMRTVEVEVDGTTITCHRVDVNARIDLVRLPYLSKPDPEWVLTDAAGHLHAPATRQDRYGNWHVISYPTLAEVKADAWYCEDCDEVHADTFDHYECPQCRERIVPGQTGPGEDVIEGEESMSIGLACFAVPNAQHLLDHAGQDGRQVRVHGKTYTCALTTITRTFSGEITLDFVVTERPEEG